MKLYLEESKKELFIKTALWNSITKIFKEEKSVDITKYLISVKLVHEKIIVKTNKPIINAEMILLDEKIKQDFYRKLENLGYKNEFSIVYR